jgi:hypothetical protein
MRVSFPQNHEINVLSHSREDDALWRMLVNRSPSPDIYFRPEYLRVSETLGDGKTVALVCNCDSLRVLCPLMVRREPRVSDAFTPYGYGGLLLLSSAPATSEGVFRILECIRQWCNSERLVCCVLRMHPLLADRFCLSGLNNANFIVRKHGETIALDLTQWNTIHQRIATLKKGRISDLSSARKSLSAIIVDELDGVRECLPIFRDIYEQTMQRLQASAFYRFPESYYAGLVEKMGIHLMLALARFQNRFVGGSLFFYDSKFLHYHLSGTTMEGLKLKAPTLLVNQAADWARTRGCQWLHLGGGNHFKDGLYNFKASFGGAVFPYTYVTIIADHRRYNTLIERAEAIWPYVPN